MLATNQTMSAARSTLQLQLDIFHAPPVAHHWVAEFNYPVVRNVSIASCERQFIRLFCTRDDGKGETLFRSSTNLLKRDFLNYRGLHSTLTLYTLSIKPSSNT